MDVIFKRRSIRHFTEKNVPEITIEACIKAGMNAPSAGDEQPWHFIVITDKKILESITTVHPHSSVLKAAPAAILVCGDQNLDEGFWVQDCSAATQNILLEITDQGLGGVWLGVYPREERVRGIKRILSLPEGIIPFSLVALGFPLEDKTPNNRYNRTRIHYNGWY